MKKTLAIILLTSFFLASCGGSSVSFTSSPEGATITFDGKKVVTPVDFSDVKPGTYTVEGTATGYLPDEMTVVVEEGKHHRFSLVFKKEIKQPVSFNTSVPADGIRFRAVKELEKYEFTPYDPATGQIGKVIVVDGPTEPLFDLKLLRNASGMDNANMLVKASAGGFTCWADCQPGADAVCPMIENPQSGKPTWNYLPYVPAPVQKIAPEFNGDKQLMRMFTGKSEPFESEFIFNAVKSADKTVWSYVDNQGRQRLLFNNGKTSSMLWSGDFGIGTLDYFVDKVTLATICDKYIFVALATDEGYRVCAMDFSGKIVAKTQTYEFFRDVKVKKYGSNVYGVLCTGKNEIVKTFTFDGTEFVEQPGLENGDMTRSSGVWIPMGKNFELRITEKLSVMIAQNKNGKYSIVYVGSRN